MYVCRQDCGVRGLRSGRRAARRVRPNFNNFKNCQNLLYFWLKKATTNI